MIRTVLVVTAALFATKPAYASVIQWTSASGGNNHHYEVIFAGSFISWDTAAALANGMMFNGQRGHLATVTSQAENDFLAQNFNAGLFDAQPGFLSLFGDSAHIGLTDRVTEGTFEWITGEDYLYQNFGPGEPNNNGGDEDFVHIVFANNATWNDGGDTSAYVVEFEAVPEPSTAMLLAIGVMVIVVRQRRMISK